MSVKILHNPRCSKSRATLQLLQDHGIEAEVILYLETPPAAGELSLPARPCFGAGSFATRSGARRTGIA